jgi:DNA-binding transcriptional LysR family regulator
MDVQGVAKLIANGLGAGVLSQHVIEAMRKSGHEIEIFKGSGKPLTNEMSIAYVTERNQRPTVKAVMDSLKKALKS